MDRLAKLVIGAGLLSAACAHAGYAWPADPKGFVRSGSWGSGYGYAASANDSTFGKIIHQPNGLKINVGGKMVTMPASYRFAANAPRVAAAALFMHPAVRTAAGVAAWLGLAGLVWDAVNKQWTIPDPDAKKSTGLLYSFDGSSAEFTELDDVCAASKGLAMESLPWNMTVVAERMVGCSDTILRVDYEFDMRDSLGKVTTYGRSVSLRVKSDSCPKGWYVTPAGCVQNAPPKVLNEPEFVDRLAPKPMPETVPKELPDGTPLPVEPSPGPWVNPEPGTNPQHRPIFVPTGDPVPNPNYDPNAAPSPENQPYIQPGTRLNPSPAPNDPWRMDVKPIDRPKPDNTPMPGPEAEPSPDPQPGDKSKPEESPGLCDLYPDILACAKMDTPSEQDIPASEKPISITPDSGWGPDGGTCPAPKVIMTQGRSIPIPFDLFCTYMQGMRPIIIAMAWLSAAFILIGAREGN